MGTQLYLCVSIISLHANSPFFPGEFSCQGMYQPRLSIHWRDSNDLKIQKGRGKICSLCTQETQRLLLTSSLEISHVISKRQPWLSLKKNPIMPSFKAMGTILTDIYIIKREKWPLPEQYLFLTVPSIYTLLEILGLEAFKWHLFLHKMKSPQLEASHYKITKVW